ncbi:hypothetical protein Q5P01_024355 [Channa striata]|uniref:Uncharacterized protein n=1 Tax=Channa striata TaxID=64152 RepID=A0AA88ITK3_CHASR|nr:hypothetical protein Q5P01_024355 [Channa striata]
MAKLSTDQSERAQAQLAHDQTKGRCSYSEGVESVTAAAACPHVDLNKSGARTPVLGGGAVEDRVGAGADAKPGWVT